MNRTVYDSIGKDYNRYRAVDKRVLQSIEDLLNLPIGSSLADIGAGTGNYSNALGDLGYQVTAIEPSEEMQCQAKGNDNVKWKPGVAEAIPLPDKSVDGVIATMSIHHFSSLSSAANEMHRICPTGPIVLFTLDPRESNTFWLEEYFPDIFMLLFKKFSPINEVANIFSNNGIWSKTIIKFSLPNDLADQHMYAGWNKPEMYFDAQFRKNTSCFALTAPSKIEKGIKRLKNDLESGAWDKDYGHLRRQRDFDAGFRFIKVKK